MNIKNVILSCDNNPDYLPYWPLVAEAWRKMGFDPTLVYVTNDPPEEWQHLEEYGHVVPYWHDPEDEGIPTRSLGKLGRWWLASEMQDKYVMIADIDMMPLHWKYFNEIDKIVQPNSLVCNGADAYGPLDKIPKDHGLFPAYYTAGQGYSFAKLLGKGPWVRFVGSYKRGNPFRTDFSDECMMRPLLEKSDLQLLLTERGWLNGFALHRLDRGFWDAKERFMINSQVVIDAHMPRPPDLKTAKILLETACISR